MAVKFMIYGDKFVQIDEYTRQEFDLLQLDAKRVMGLEPTRKGPWHYIAPPEEGTDTWNWATRILALEWPVVKAFAFGGGAPLIVNERDLREIGE